MTDTHETSPLDIARKSFQLLVTGPQPLSVDGGQFDGLPRRLIPLDELRDFLLSCHCSYSTRDAVWTYLVRRSRSEHNAWTVACAGLALPSLAATARWLTARSRADRVDIHSAVLTGFLQALTTIDTEKPAIIVRLGWAARRAGQAALEESLDAPRTTASGGVVPSESPAGHPDLVLAQAVGDRTLTPTEADLICTTRLDGAIVAEWAVAHGHRPAAAYKARARAETRLVAWLRVQIAEADPEDPVASSVLAALSVANAPEHDDTPRSSRAVSGRLRNGRTARRPASKTTFDAGLLECGETTPPSPRTAPDSEVRRCA